MQSMPSYDLVYLQKLPAVWCLHHKTLKAQLVCSKQAHVQPATTLCIGAVPASDFDPCHICLPKGQCQGVRAVASFVGA